MNKAQHQARWSRMDKHNNLRLFEVSNNDE
jgi:hypothetical protein